MANRNADHHWFPSIITRSNGYIPSIITRSNGYIPSIITRSNGYIPSTIRIVYTQRTISVGLVNILE